MIKRLELSDPQSCMSRAEQEEPTFVLLGRDITAPAAIRAWCELRIVAGKNKRDDPQIIEALSCAALMQDYKRERHELWTLSREPSLYPNVKYAVKTRRKR